MICRPLCSANTGSVSVARPSGRSKLRCWAYAEPAPKSKALDARSAAVTFFPVILVFPLFDHRHTAPRSPRLRHARPCVGKAAHTACLSVEFTRQRLRPCRPIFFVGIPRWSSGIPQDHDRNIAQSTALSPGHFFAACRPGDAALENQDRRQRIIRHRDVTFFFTKPHFRENSSGN